MRTRAFVFASAAILLTTTALLAHAAPTATYDTPDHARFLRFLDKTGSTDDYSAFQEHLRTKEVSGIVPAWTLWRQGTDWRALDTPAFAAPPRDQWSAIVPTLEVLRRDVLPVTGEIEVVSGFRTASYNQRAGGAAGSRHKWFEAVDVVPTRRWTRDSLHERLLRLWRARGPTTRMGLGLYARTRFHVDTHRHRRW